MNIMGSIYSKKGDYDNAFKHYKEALVTIEKLKGK